MSSIDPGTQPADNSAVFVIRWVPENGTVSATWDSNVILLAEDVTYTSDSTAIFTPEPEERPTVAPWPFPPWPAVAVGPGRLLPLRERRRVGCRLAPARRRGAIGVRNWRAVV